MTRPTITSATDPNTARQRAGEVVDDPPRPGRPPQVEALTLDPGDSVQDELDQEVVQIGEVAVQDTLGAAGLVSDGPAGQRTRPFADQHALRGVEQLPTGIAQGYARRHAHPLARGAPRGPIAEWAHAHL